MLLVSSDLGATREALLPYSCGARGDSTVRDGGELVTVCGCLELAHKVGSGLVIPSRGAACASFEVNIPDTSEEDMVSAETFCVWSALRGGCDRDTGEDHNRKNYTN